MPRPVGRPPLKVDEKVIEKAYALALKGLTNMQIAAGLGWSYTTYLEKRDKFPELLEAIEAGEADFIGEIEEKHAILAKQGDIKALQFTLTKRRRKEYADALELTGANGEPVQVQVYLPKQGRGPEGN